MRKERKNNMDNEEAKKVDRNDLIDEILSILFDYLIKENKKKDKFIKQLWNEKIRGDKNENTK